jgi:phosphoribosylformylglycinamidine cyclo-ligase
VLRVGHIAAGDKGCTVTGSAETWSARAGWSATHLG